MPKAVQNTGRKAVERDEKKSTYRVAPGHTITARQDIDGEMRDVIFEAGEEIEVSEAEVAKSPHAFVKQERRRARDGQVSRLKAQYDALKRENEDLKARLNAKDDPEFENAAESLKARGDNHIGRGEPTPFGVPSDLLDAADRRIALAEAGLDETSADDDAPDTEEMSGGMKGLARAKAGQESAKAPADPRGPASSGVPSQGGQSVPPGASKPTGNAS